MSVEGQVPGLIAEEGVQFAKGWVFPLVAPREPPILQMDLLELT